MRVIAGVGVTAAATGLLIVAAAPARADCPDLPTSNVYAYVCSTTSNLGNGVAIVVNNGQVETSTTNPSGISTTTQTGVSNARQDLLNDVFNPNPATGQVNSSQNETVTNAYGSGSESATAGQGDVKNLSYSAIPFANGDPGVSGNHIQGPAVIPSLHASASGSASSSSAGVTVNSAGQASFSDVLTITQQQVQEAYQEMNLPLNGATGLYVQFDFSVDGSLAAGPLTASTAAFGSAEADFNISLTNDGDVSGPGSADGGSDKLFRQQTPAQIASNDLAGEVFTVSGYLSPTNPLTILALLTVEGTAVGANGVDGSYNAAYSDTAAFLGVSFYADAALTEPLANVQIGSALGYDYVPADATLAVPTPEPSTWVALLTGFGALGWIGRRRRSKSVDEGPPKRAA